MRVALHGRGAGVPAGRSVYRARAGGGVVPALAGALRPALHGGGVLVTAGGPVRMAPGLPPHVQRPDDGGVAGRALQGQQLPGGRRDSGSGRSGRAERSRRYVRTGEADGSAQADRGGSSHEAERPEGSGRPAGGQGRTGLGRAHDGGQGPGGTGGGVLLVR